MANVKATMTDIRVIIRELSRGTSLREMERKLKLSRTSLRNYRDRAEASGRSMVDLLALNDAELQAIMLKGDGHRGRDSDRYAFMQERIEDYARDMMRKHMTYDVLYEEYLKSTDNPYARRAQTIHTVTPSSRRSSRNMKGITTTGTITCTSPAARCSSTYPGARCSSTLRATIYG